MSYKSKLDIRQTEVAIKQVKDFFEKIGNCFYLMYISMSIE